MAATTTHRASRTSKGRPPRATHILLLGLSLSTGTLLLAAAPAALLGVKVTSVDSRLAVRVALAGRPGAVSVHREGDKARVSIADARLGSSFAGGTHFAWTPSPGVDVATLRDPIRLDRLEVVGSANSVSVLFQVPSEISIDVRRDGRGLLLVLGETAVAPDPPALAQAATLPSGPEPEPTTAAEAPSPAPARPVPDDEHRRIRQILFYISNIYTEGQAREASWPRLANRLHITTRESVIRSRLLFKEGDVLDQALIEESGRKLRGFAFLNDAEITVVPVDDQTVDVEVRTRDAWSFAPSVDIGGGGGLVTVDLGLTESNLLGYGKKAYVNSLYESDVGWTTTLGYRDYHLFDSKWTGSGSYKTGPLIESFFVMVAKPLHSIDAKWSFGSVAYAADSIVRLFEEGEESSRFAKDKVMVQAYAKRSFGERFNKNKVRLKVKYFAADYSTLGEATTEPPPPDQANLTPSVGIDAERGIDWRKYTFLDKLGRTEETWVGRRFGAHVGYGIPLEDGFELWDLGGHLSVNRLFSGRQLLRTALSVTSEVERNTIAVASARYYRGFSRHTVATRFKVSLGYELDSSRQFTLGADSGLRGYPARQFTGSKLVLINLEDRQFWGELSIGPKLAVGTVVFVDAGNVWKEDEDVEVNELNWSAGVGVRLSLSNLPHQPIFRADIGWALSGDDQGSYALTIGMEQQF